MGDLLILREPVNSKTAHLTPGIPQAFHWSFALYSLWKQPYFLTPCCCIEMVHKEELLPLSDKKFHNDDIKSVWNRVRSADWSLEKLPFTVQFGSRWNLLLTRFVENQHTHRASNLQTWNFKWGILKVFWKAIHDGSLKLSTLYGKTKTNFSYMPLQNVSRVQYIIYIPRCLADEDLNRLRWVDFFKFVFIGSHVPRVT